MPAAALILLFSFVAFYDLGLMAASLANGGINPVTKERVLRSENVERVLSVMSTCGMYDYSGEWIFKVGLPAKSGVGGGVLGVLPGQLGAAVFSPRLDAKGNSVRGVRVFSELSKLFNLHLLNSPSVSNHSIRRIYRLSEVGSHRQRRKTDQEAIRTYGSGVSVIELQGDLFFSAAERLIRAVTSHTRSTGTFVFDIRRVGLTDRATEDLLLKVAIEQAQNAKELIFVDPNNTLCRSRFVAGNKSIEFADDIDAALEACEDKLIAAHVQTPLVGGLVPFHDFELFAGFSPTQFSQLEGMLEMESFPTATKIIEQGSAPDYIYLLAKGLVSIYFVSDSGLEKRQRIAAFGPGVCFGDLAAIDGSVRSADVWTDEPSTCYTLSTERLRQLEMEDPACYARFIRNTLLINIDRLRRCNREIASLKS